MDTTQDVKPNRSGWMTVAVTVLKYLAVFVILEILQIVAVLSVISDQQDLDWIERAEVLRSFYSWIWIGIVLLLAWRWKHRVFWLGLSMIIVSALSLTFVEQIHLFHEKQFGPFSEWDDDRSFFFIFIHFIPGFLLICLGFLVSIIELFRFKKKPWFVTVVPSFIRKLIKPLIILVLGILTILLPAKYGLWEVDYHYNRFNSQTYVVREVFYLDNNPMALVWEENGAVWNVETGRKVIELSSSGINSYQMISGSILADIDRQHPENTVIHFMNLTHGKKIKTLKPPQLEEIAPGAPNEFWIVSNSILQRWNCISGTVLAEIEIPANIPEFHLIRVSPDSRRMLIDNEDGLRILDTSTLEPIQSIDIELLKPYGYLFNGGMESHDLTRVFLVDQDQDYPGILSNFYIFARLWNTETGSLIGEIKPPRQFPLKFWLNWPNPNPSWILSSAFSPDGTMLLTCSFDGAARIYDVQSQDLLHEFLTTSAIPLITGAFSPDGSRVLAGSDNGNVFLWDVESGDLILHRKFWKEYEEKEE